MTARQILRVDVVASVFNGKTPSKLQQRDSGHSVLKIKDVDKLGRFRGTFSGHVDPQLAKKHVRQQLVGGETLVLNAAHSATHVASKTFYAGHEVVGALATGEWLIVRWRDDTADPRYGNHWINAAETRFRLRRLVNGIHLYPKDVARLQIPLPPLAEQKRIAGILDAADALRAKRREALGQLDTLLQSTFLDMFGDPVTNPMGWEKRELSHLCRFRSGYAWKAKSFNSDGIGSPVIRIQNVGTESSELIHTTEYPIERFWVERGEYLLSLSGSFRLAPWNGPRALLNQRIVKLTPESIVAPAYFGSALSTQLSAIETMGRHALVNNVALSDLKKVELCLPPIDLQHRFAAIAESVEQQKASQRAHLDELDTLFASLQSRAFRGDF